MRKRLILFFLSLIFTAFSAANSETHRLNSQTLAQSSREVQSAVRLSAFLIENQIRVSLNQTSQGYIVLHAEIETLQNFHLYKDRIQFWTEKDPALNFEEWQLEVLESPQTVRFLDPVSQSLKEGYRGQSLFKIKASLPRALQSTLAADHKIPLVISFQACTDKICLLPAAIRTDVKLGELKPLSEGTLFEILAKRVKTSAEHFKNNMDSTGNMLNLTNLLILLLAGLLTAFTPCVYPLYPITLGIFSRWSTSGHISPLKLALSYCTGLTLSYACLGLVSAASGSVFGSLTQKPLFLLGVGLFILFNAIVFSGFLPFQAPQFLMNFFATSGADNSDRPASSGKRMSQAAFMGMGLGVVASPCVGPVLVTLLAWLSSALAKTPGASAYLSGFTLLSFFGIGLSLPFLTLGFVLFRMHKTLRLGRITPYFKHLGTLLMVLASLYYLIPAAQQLFFKQAHLKQEAKLLHKELKIYNLQTWPRQRISVIDFRADWCAACVQLENETFSAPEVLSEFKKGDMDFVQVDLSHMTPELQQQALKMKVVSLPSVLFTRSNGEICEQLSLYEFENATKFKKRLEQARSECQ